MHVQRQGRIGVEIPVMVTTVLDSRDAAITNLTEHGAHIIGCAVAAGTRFQIEYRGQTLYAQCRWSGIDRMGIRFIFPLTDGPLYERLVIARATHYADDAPLAAGMAFAPVGGRAPLSSGRAQSGFGRRAN